MKSFMNGCRRLRRSGPFAKSEIWEAGGVCVQISQNTGDKNTYSLRKMKQGLQDAMEEFKDTPQISFQGHLVWRDGS